jgi:formylglycine-generating enzyme required for sulfatase activity
MSAESSEPTISKSAWRAGAVGSPTPSGLRDSRGDHFRATLTKQRRQAIIRSMQMGIVAFVASYSDEFSLEADALTRLFANFFGDPEVCFALGSLVRNETLDVPKLQALFERRTGVTDGLASKLSTALEGFQAAVVISFLADPELEELNRANERFQGLVPYDRVRKVGKLINFLTTAQFPDIGINAQEILAHNVVNGQQIIFNLDRLSDDHPEERRLRALRMAYLNRLFEAVRRVSLEGVDLKVAADPKAQIQLDQIYTQLLSVRQEVASSTNQGNEQLGPGTNTSILSEINRHNRIVVLGDPGGGKSTLVNFLALCITGEALDRADVNMKRLADGETNLGRIRFAGMLPIRIVLRDFVARGLPTSGPGTADHIWNFITEELNAASLGEYASDLKQELLEHGGFVMLDGLDEVPDANRRRIQIKEAVEDFSKTYRNCHILVTSRTYAYQNQQWILSGFEVATLARFSHHQINTFVDRWYTHIAKLRGLKEKDAQGRAELLKGAIAGSERLRELAERPLLLTLMASLHAWRGGALPERREELYSDAVELLLVSWEGQRVVYNADGTVAVIQPSLAEWLQVDRERVQSLLNQLAFEAHLSSDASSGTADILEDRLIGGLTRLSRNPDVRPARIIEYISHRAGLLLPRGPGVYTFPHRTFQEYLAACYLTGDSYPDELAELTRADPLRWREVALLAGAKATSGVAAAIWLLVEALCYSEPSEGIRNSADAQAAVIAAEALCQSTLDLSNIRPHHRPKIELVRKWQVRLLEESALPATERVRSALALGMLGDPRGEITTIPGMEFCFVAPDDPGLGIGKTDEESAKEQAISTPGPPAPSRQIDHGYWLSKYPVSNAQFDQFVEDGGYRRSGYWREAQDCGIWQKGEVRVRAQGAQNSTESWESRPRLSAHGWSTRGANLPAVGLSWYEAVAFCRWLTESFRDLGYLAADLVATLPSEMEWERGARGGVWVPDRPEITAAEQGFLLKEAMLWQWMRNPWRFRLYAWGNEADPDRANYEATGLQDVSPLGCFSRGASPYGVQEMCGNVWEWTRTAAGRVETVESLDRELSLPPELKRYGRGGQVRLPAERIRCSSRWEWDPLMFGGPTCIRVVIRPSS